MTNPRRELLQGLSAFAVLPTLRSEATLVLHGGHVLTMDTSQPLAQAVAITDSRFVAVGTNEDVLNLAGARTTRVDLGGKTVVPGFIDAHTHVAYSGYRHLKEVDCALPSIAAILDALRGRAAKTPAGEWVMGFKYDDTKTSEGRPLTRDDLDAVSRDHPVFVQHRGGHTAYVNSAG